jgi:hypothetical protein
MYSSRALPENTYKSCATVIPIIDKARDVRNQPRKVLSRATGNVSDFAYAPRIENEWKKGTTRLESLNELKDVLTGLNLLELKGNVCNSVVKFTR